MQQYAREREDFMLLSLTGYERYMRRALEARKNAIVNAWSMEDPLQRENALRGAWRNFGMTWRVANNQLKDLRTKAWRTYRLNLITCGPQADDEERGGYGMDSQF